jgi:acetyl-CoA synthetase
MTKKIIRKTRKQLRLRPNMGEYEKVYRKFKWKDAEKEVEWFKDGKINAAYNAVDKHLKTDLRYKTALYWEGANGEEERYSYEDIAELSNKFANVLKKLGVRKGDRVFIFLPRIPPLHISFLGILKIGAIAGTMFAAFGPSALLDRLGDCGAKVLVTTSELAKRVYKIKRKLPCLKKIIIVDGKVKKAGEVDYKKQMEKASPDFKIKEMHPDDHAFMLYTSGTTGKPKGVIHKHYAIVHQHLTAKWILDLHQDDIYWCTADPGWITGVAYGILGPWSNGVTQVVHAGRFSVDEWYSIIEKHRVTVWYTAPTAIRMLMRDDGRTIKKFDLTSLRYLCSVGEPLNPEAVWWGLETFGKPFHDNWWQTETGGILIANYPRMPIKPGSMGKPFPGIKAAIVNDKMKKLRPGKEGKLVIKPGWPSMMASIWNNPKKYKSYFKNGWYITGDRAYKDRSGYFHFVGRADDVINTAGHRVGPFEVESGLIEHPAVVEAGVIGKPDLLYGEIIKAFVVLKKGYKPSNELKKKITVFVKKHCAGHAYPREIEFRKKLPKTRSGKIMRRVLKAEELGEEIGDVSTLTEE